MPEAVAGCSPGPGLTQLQPLPPSTYPAYLAAAVVAYAQDKVDAGHWPAATAPQRARDEFAAHLPLGLATPQHHLFQVLQSSSGPVVGWLWLALENTASHGGDCSGFVYDLRISPEHRRQGHAGRALQAVEPLARALGAKSLGLHVFAHNPAALALYRQQGYCVSSLNLHKHW